MTPHARERVRALMYAVLSWKRKKYVKKKDRSFHFGGLINSDTSRKHVIYIFTNVGHDNVSEAKAIKASSAYNHKKKENYILIMLGGGTSINSAGPFLNR
jgi:hypothetical protein